MEIIRATDLEKSKDREAIIKQLAENVMKSIVEANKEGKREIMYGSCSHNYCDKNNKLHNVEDYPEVEALFRQYGYRFRSDTSPAYGGRMVTHIYICW